MRCTKIRGKKGDPHTDPSDPPRRRANKAVGHGTWDRDRPPVLGLAGRDSRRVCLKVIRHAGRRELEPLVLKATRRGTKVYTDEWQGYKGLSDKGRVHATVCHKPGSRQWARDDDGDGVREVHNNTLEGLWTGLRNFMRPFRGVHKEYLDQYVAVFESAHNTKTATPKFLRTVLRPITRSDR
jgi:transposase-like protein